MSSRSKEKVTAALRKFFKTTDKNKNNGEGNGHGHGHEGGAAQGGGSNNNNASTDSPGRRLRW